MRGFFYGLTGLIGITALLCFVPVRVKAAGCVTLRGGYAQATVRYGLFAIRLHMRIYMLESPYFTVDLLRRDGTVRRQIPIPLTLPRPTALEKEVFGSVTVSGLFVELCLGIRQAEQLTAMLCGWIGTVMSQGARLICKGGEAQISVIPLWDVNVCRLNLEGILSLRPVNIIRERFFSEERN